MDISFTAFVKEKDVLGSIFCRIFFVSYNLPGNILILSFVLREREREENSCGLEASGRKEEVLEGHLLTMRYPVASTQISQPQTLSLKHPGLGRKG